MTPHWTLQDAILRVIGEMFVNSQLTDEEIEREEYPWKIGLSPGYICRALDTLKVNRSELTCMLAGEIDEYIGVDRQAERDVLTRRDRKATRAGRWG